MPLSRKQQAYLDGAVCRWNIKVGATRSGKTYCDYFTIPMRIRAASDDGIIVLIGYTVATLCRNILDPMRRIWGEALVGKVSSSDTVRMFGRTCWLIGAGRSLQAAKLQGAGISYCYGDEITTWDEEVFHMLKSRLDRKDSCFDGTCNPAAPTHWFKRFLDSGADIFQQVYTIDDNPFLKPEFVSALKREYAGTVYYDRYILGRWTAAEGAIYRCFADDPDSFAISAQEAASLSFCRITVGVDFGGTKSGTSFVATGFTSGFEKLVVLSAVRYTDEMDSVLLGKRFCAFLEDIASRFRMPCAVYCDSAEPVLIRSLRSDALEKGIPAVLYRARKGAIRDRIRMTLRLMAQKRILLTPEADTLRDALLTAVWSSGCNEEERLDDGSSDIDTLDAFEYSFERDMSRLIR